MASKRERQQELEQTYYFLCRCLKCTNPEPFIEMTGAACPNSDCDNCLDSITMKPDEECSKCGSIISGDFIQTFQDVTEMTRMHLDSMKETTFNDEKWSVVAAVSRAFKRRKISEKTVFIIKNKEEQNNKELKSPATRKKRKGSQILSVKSLMHYIDLDVCNVCLIKQKGVLYKYNVKHIKTLDLAFDSSIEFGKFDDATKYGLQLVKSFYDYYGNIHPLTGLLHLKLAKLMLYQNHPKDALQHLTKAKEILKITHGLTSSLFKEHIIPLFQDLMLENGA